MKEEIKTIILGLIEKTQKNQVNWVHINETNLIQNEEGPSNIEDDYAVSTSSFSINIFKKERVNKSAIRLNILNDRGNLVTYIEAEKGESDYILLSDLLTITKKYVLGEDRLLNNIKEDLAKPGVLGKVDDVPF